MDELPDESPAKGRPEQPVPSIDLTMDDMPAEDDSVVLTPWIDVDEGESAGKSLPAQRMKPRRNEAMVEIEIDVLRPPPEEVLLNVIFYLSYASVVPFAGTSKQIFNLVSEQVQQRLIRLPQWPQERGPVMESPVAIGAVKLLARFNPGRRLADDRLQPGKLPGVTTDSKLPSVTTELAREIVMSLGWRDYTSKLRTVQDPRSDLTLETLSRNVHQHAIASSMIRDNTRYPFVNPEEWQAAMYTSKIGELEGEVAKHWLGLFKTSGLTKWKAPEDDAARGLATKLGTWGEGHDLSVERGNQGPPVVYSNRDLSDEQVDKIKSDGFESGFLAGRDRGSWESRKAAARHLPHSLSF